VKPFIPQHLPRDDLDWGELVPLIASANRAIARYDRIVQGLVNPSVLLSPLAAREAVLSSMGHADDSRGVARIRGGPS
jgi:Fic/DOC family N-terminal